jgi:hypothetical protein
LVSGGAAGLALTLRYWLVDLQRVGSSLWTPFMWMGMNAITM